MTRVVLALILLATAMLSGGCPLASQSTGAVSNAAPAAQQGTAADSNYQAAAQSPSGFSPASNIPAGVYNAAYDMNSSCTSYGQVGKDVSRQTISLQLTSAGGILIDGANIATGVVQAIGTNGVMRVNHVAVGTTSILIEESGQLLDGSTVSASYLFSQTGKDEKGYLLDSTYPHL